MKKSFLLLLLLPLMVLSCTKLPQANFSVSNSSVNVGEEVVFYNYSTDADRFEWNFGDGYMSNDVNPAHVYTQAGSYVVTLTAITKGYSSQNSAVINVYSGGAGSVSASFSVSSANPTVGEELFITNTSVNAVRFEWDFGDGIVSNAIDPIHVYTINGVYEIELTAWAADGSPSYAYLTVEARVPRMLAIEVVEYYQLYRVPGASVILYPTVTDWEQETNAICEGFTDEYGIVVFSGLPDDDYYVDVWEATHDNLSLASEDVGHIKIEWVEPNTLNWFVAYVDVVDHSTKGIQARRCDYVTKNAGRKASDFGSLINAMSIDKALNLIDKSIKVK